MSTKHRRLSRLLEMIALIRGNRQLRAKDLASHFSVSAKRIFDDINELNAAGIPVEFEGDGYQIQPNVFMPPTGFQLDESMSLLLGLSALEHQGMIDRPARERLSAKVLGATVGADGLECAELMEVLHIQPEWDCHESPSCFTRIVRACLHHTVIEIHYLSAHGDAPTTRRVAPCKLTFRRHAWYLLAYSMDQGEMHTYRISRLNNVTETGETHVPPTEAVERWQESWGVFSGVAQEVEVHFDAHVATYIRARRFPTTKRVDHEDGSLTLSFTTRDLEEACWWIIQYAAHATVLQPEALRLMIQDKCREVLDHYGQNPRAKPA